MKRTTGNWICPLVASLMLGALGSASLGAESPSADSLGAAVVVEENQSPPPSGIVWGATSEDHRSCDHFRAGCPQSLRKITAPSNTRFYGGYYVGGGTPTRGAGRCDDDGTWGWDYSGILFPKRISLNWTAKGLYQGGTGAYKTDGPKLRKEKASLRSSRVGGPRPDSDRSA